jgi:hypothetical protein
MDLLSKVHGNTVNLVADFKSGKRQKDDFKFKKLVKSDLQFKKINQRKKTLLNNGQLKALNRSN